ncbi:hypothetical protein [Mycobacterium sp. PSTR-4-N]|uniref:hypothetical protein n=1 Tax=Mycobacterium sp. PSTR-4-N TaxID=2917745 RepID=UPI001F14F8CD|nr:hypothetical protein [Mycobacterium sp. PSTR-4-N]MCG7594410.1 hypothetical protein [Mycobacterium sp. PSTR-4-N]
MASGEHIGRVGALAVALGIGYAVAASSGVAWAAPDTSSGAGTSAASDGTTNRVAHPLRERGPKKPARPSKTDAGSGTAESEHPTAESGDPAAEGTVTRRAHRPKATRRATPEADHGVEGTSDRDDAAPGPTPRRSVAASLPISSSAPASSSSVPDSTGPAAQAHPGVTVLRSLFAPHTPAHGSDEPDAPAAAPLIWTMLAQARRQVAEGSDVGTTGPQTSTSQTLAAEAASVAVPGRPNGPVVVGADGTLYQVTSDATGTRVSILDSDGNVVTTTGYLPGGTANSRVDSIAARPDGTLLVSTVNGGLRNRSTISAVDNQGEVTTVARLVGGAGGLTVGADGSVYTETTITVPFIPYGSYSYRFVRISPDDTVRSLPPRTSLTLAEDGTAYLLSSGFGSSTLRAFDTAGKSKAIFVPYSASALGEPVLGPDGTLYLTADVRLFGSQTTRLYTVNGTSSSVRTLSGLAGVTVVTDDGVYLETHTFDGAKDNGVDGTTYISKLTRTSIDTLDPIDGRISTLTGFQVTPAGAVYAPIVDPTADTTAVAVFDSAGNRTTIVLPGTTPADPGFVQAIGAGPHADEFGYVRYSAGGADHVAVLGADGTVVRTVDLPAGATVDGPVIFGPDGTPYAVVRYPAGTLPPGTLATQVLSLSTDTPTPPVPDGRNPGFVDIQFAPDGTGYLLTRAGSPSSITVTGFDAQGATGTSLTLADPLTVDGTKPLVFAPDGTGYVVDYGPSGGAVYALSTSGVNKLLDIPFAAGMPVYAVVIGADGTPYLTTGSGNSTTVTPLA